MTGLVPQGREPLFVPCTPLGCIEILDRCGVTIAGKRAVVVRGMGSGSQDEGA